MPRATATNPWSALQELVNQRRHELGMTWEELGEASGLSVNTLRNVNAGAQGPRPATLGGLRQLGLRERQIVDALKADVGDPESETHPEVHQLTWLAGQLDDHHRGLALAIVRSIVERQRMSTPGS